MKNITLIITLFFTLQSFSFAQTSSLEWFEDIQTAKEHAQNHEKDILMVFAGSDWCKPCIQFKQDILKAKDFQQWATDKLVILYLDFPARKKNQLSSEQTAHNEALAERFNKSGAFPNILVINAEEAVLANPKFRKRQDAKQFITALESSL